MPTRIPVGRGFHQRVYPGFVGPGFVDEIAVFTSPLEGLDAYSRIQQASGSTAASAVHDEDPVPAEKMWFVPFLMIYHNEGTINPNVSLHLVDPAGRVVGVYARGDQAGGIPANQYTTLERPIIVPPLWFLRAQLSAPTVGANVVVIRYAFIEVQKGEYVHGI